VGGDDSGVLVQHDDDAEVRELVIGEVGCLTKPREGILERPGLDRRGEADPERRGAEKRATALAEVVEIDRAALRVEGRDQPIGGGSRGSRRRHYERHALLGEERDERGQLRVELPTAERRDEA
jgi:hypothetical protein